jgi:hypothetical protein
MQRTVMGGVDGQAGMKTIVTKRRMAVKIAPTIMGFGLIQVRA